MDLEGLFDREISILSIEITILLLLSYMFVPYKTYGKNVIIKRIIERKVYFAFAYILLTLTFIINISKIITNYKLTTEMNNDNYYKK